MVCKAKISHRKNSHISTEQLTYLHLPDYKFAKISKSSQFIITWQDWSSETWTRHGSHARWRSSTMTRNWQDAGLWKQSAMVTGVSESASVNVVLITLSQS